MEKIYRKLVRDNIPSIIAESGNDCITTVLDETDYRHALEAKLKEEVSEYIESHEAVELADILEVVFALADLDGHSPGTLEDIRQHKAAVRGSFSQRIFLDRIDDRNE